MKRELKPLQVFGLKVFAWDLTLITVSIGLNTFLFSHFLPDTEAQIADIYKLRVYLNPLELGVAIWASWVFAVIVAKTWAPSFAGSGLPDYVKIGRLSIGVLAGFAFAALFFKLDVPRLYLSSTFLSTTAALIFARWLTQFWLRGQRKRGLFTNRVALLGPVRQTAAMANLLLKNPAEGYQPTLIAVFVEHLSETTDKKLAKLGLPSLVFDPANPIVWQNYDIDAVVVIGSDHLDAKSTKRLSWSLENTGIELVVAPALVDFAGDRVSTIDVAGSPFLRIQGPQFFGSKALLKRGFDIVVALVAITLSLPIWLLTGLLVYLEDKGPIFFAHTRIGRNGREFKMLKFRSMSPNAHRQFDALKASVENEGNAVQFKLKQDPRITRVGSVIRKFSIDELPQFLNVLLGSMSVVGPRPHVQEEVRQYEPDAHRRLLVKPGITGLWQVSGRSSLSWDESVALDLDYVENWSVMGDALIVAKTVKTVLTQNGAY